VKVAVCVKEVPDASAPKRLDPQTFRLDRGVAGALNEFDTHAIEEGLQLKDKGGEGEVVAVLMGPERAADSLRRSSARAPTSSSSASRPATPTAPCSGQRSPTGSVFQ
jgi:electron transfer flavoprotein beta subunit